MLLWRKSKLSVLSIFPNQCHSLLRCSKIEPNQQTSVCTYRNSWRSPYLGWTDYYTLQNMQTFHVTKICTSIPINNSTPSLAFHKHNTYDILIIAHSGFTHLDCFLFYKDQCHSDHCWCLQVRGIIGQNEKVDLAGRRYSSGLPGLHSTRCLSDGRQAEFT